MLTSRPFDEVIDRSQTRSFDPSSVGNIDQAGDKAVIKGYAQRYLKEIISMLDIVPRVRASNWFSLSLIAKYDKMTT